MTLLAALLVGASLALAGAVLQNLFRNPLAEPYMLGMVGGSALFAALVTVFGLTAAGAFVLPLASLLGAIFALTLVFLVAHFAARARFTQTSNFAIRASSSTIVLAGFVVGSLMGSLDMFVLSFATPEDFANLSKWLYGSLANISRFSLALASICFIFAISILFAIRRELNVMELGRDEAECLGINTRVVSAAAICAVALITSVSVALAGAVGFIGLIVPHLVRRFFGSRSQILLPVSALVGALFLALAQLIIEQIPAKHSIGVGIICALIGAPAFLAILATHASGEGRDI